MNFENIYASFLNAVEIEDYIKAESIIAQCDDRRTVLISAINDLGEPKVVSMIKLFRGIGLKRGLEKIVQNYSGFELAKNAIVNPIIDKTIYISEKNRLNNEKYHLTGSSFENERKVRATA